MVCECGHNKDRHETYRDSGKNEGKCTGLGMNQRCKKSCEYYHKSQLTFRGKSS
jgi:hypothetical protein